MKSPMLDGEMKKKFLKEHWLKHIHLSYQYVTDTMKCTKRYIRTERALKHLSSMLSPHGIKTTCQRKAQLRPKLKAEASRSSQRLSQRAPAR